MKQVLMVPRAPKVVAIYINLLNYLRKLLMPMKKVVTEATPVDVITISDCAVSALYGVQHGKNPAKRYKVHTRADSQLLELISFTNCTAHLNEDDGFSSLAEIHDYCKAKKHTLMQFDNMQEFGEWLAS